MKNSLLIITVIAIFGACNNENQTYQSNDPAIETVEEIQVEELTNKSAFDFELAIAAYEGEDMNAVINLIKIGINDLREESDGFSEKAKANVEHAIKHLDGLVNQMKNGESVPIVQLQVAFAHVEMTIGHTYLVHSQKYALKDPEKAKIALQKSIDKMESALEKLNEDANVETTKMITDLKSSMDNFNRNAEEIAGRLAAQVAKMESWIGAHAEKLGIHPAYSD